MKLALLICVSLLAAVGRAQSLSLGTAPRVNAFEVIEIPAYQKSAFRSKTLEYDLDLGIANQLVGPKGLTANLGLDYKFAPIKFLGLPIGSAWAHVGLGVVEFEGSKPRPCVVVGLTIR